MAVFPNASCAVTVTSLLSPAVIGSVIPETTNTVAAPGLTVNVFEVPFAVAEVSVAVMSKLPTFEIVTLWEESTPLVNAAVVPSPAIKFPEEVISTVPLKPVTVLPRKSRAVIWMLNGLPAV